MWLFFAGTFLVAAALSWVYAHFSLGKRRSAPPAPPPPILVAGAKMGRSGRWDCQSDDGSRLHPLRSWGLWGRAPGDLNNPRFLLNVEDGVMIADSGNDRLQVFSPEGVHLRTILGTRPGHPTGLASDGTHLWVADSMNCSVQKCLLDGTTVRRVGTYGEDDNQFSGPEGLALACGKLFVADEGNHRIVALEAEGLRWLFCFGSHGTGEGQLRNPVGLSAIEDGNGNATLFVRDTGNHRICAFDTEGRFLRCFGSQGSGPGQFNCPTGMSHDGRGRILVSELGPGLCGGRVQVVSVHGEPLQVLPLPSSKRLYGMCVRDGCVFTADYEKHQIHVLALRKEPLPPSPGR